MLVGFVCLVFWFSDDLVIWVVEVVMKKGWSCMIEYCCQCVDV